MKWFKHETNANTDAKLKRLRLKYGMEGYGLYWYCLELIGASVEPHNITFVLEHDAEIIANDTNIHYELIQEMMRYMVDLGLFESDGKLITCLKMRIRADEYTNKILRTIAINTNTPNNIRALSGHTPDKIPSNRKNKKNREKEVKEFVPPSLNEIEKYVKERGDLIDAKKLFDYYTSSNWKDSNEKKVKNWKQKCISWERRSVKPKEPEEDYGKGGI